LELCPHDWGQMIQTQQNEPDNVIIHETTPATLGKAPFGALFTSYLFYTVYNQYGILGFNPQKVVTPQGGIVDQPSWAMAFENDFYNIDVHTMEWYLNYNSADYSVPYFRPIYTNILFTPDEGTQRAYTRFDIGTSIAQPGYLRLYGGSGCLSNFTRNAAKFYFPEVDIYSNLYVNNSTHHSQLIMGDNALGSRSSLRLRTGKGKYTWLITTQYHINNALEIIPSTMAEGSTFTNPVFIASYDGRCAVGTPNSAPNDKTLPGETISFYLDQANNQLRVRVKYSDGTLKTGVIPWPAPMDYTRTQVRVLAKLDLPPFLDHFE
jgi:hypothetical protein